MPRGVVQHLVGLRAILFQRRLYGQRTFLKIPIWIKIALKIKYLLRTLRGVLEA